jgi:hypothetical protein
VRDCPAGDQDTADRETGLVPRTVRPVAKEYAGHTDSDSAGSTGTYVRASVQEVTAALAALTGEDHPLASDG